jgi:transcriptional regulator with XRE-family HTH domain
MQYVNGLMFDIAYSRTYSPVMSIGNRLDTAMAKAKIPSQSALQRASGVPQATISRILKGDSKKGPETETIKKLAAACNVSFDWLNEGIGQSDRKGRAHVEPLEARESANSDALTAGELIELVNAYSSSSAEDRNFILKSAKTAAKRAAALISRRAGHE